MRSHRIQFAARNEGLRYEDESGALRFDLSRSGRTWAVSVPPSAEPNFTTKALTAEERARIYPRISAFLSRVWWFGVWPASYKVEFRTKGNDA